MFRRSVVVVAVGMGALLFSGASTAVASTPSTTPVPTHQPGHVAQVPGAPSKVLVGAKKAGSGKLSPAALKGSAPGTCYGQTDIPHYSTHVGGTANVTSRTVCPGSVYVETELDRDRWYGSQYLSDVYRSWTGTVDINTSYRCAGQGIYTYRANSYHEASTDSYAYTANSGRFNC